MQVHYRAHIWDRVRDAIHAGNHDKKVASILLTDAEWEELVLYIRSEGFLMRGGHPQFMDDGIRKGKVYLYGTPIYNEYYRQCMRKKYGLDK